MSVQNTGDLLTGPNFGTPGAVTGGATAASGSATTIARSDHVHSTASMPVLLASATLTSAAASYTFSSIPSGYSNIELVSAMRTSSTSQTEQWSAVTLNSDSAANYLNQAGGATTYLYNGVAPCATNGLATSVGVGRLFIINYANTSWYKSTQLIYGNNSGSGISLGSWSPPFGVWKSTAAVTSITIATTLGDNFLTNTTFRLYGYP